MRKINREDGCSFVGCQETIGKYGASGMCHKHYQKFMRELKREKSDCFCQCGCGGKTVPGFMFLSGHHSKTESGREALRKALYRGAITNRGNYLSIKPRPGVVKYQHVVIAESAIGRTLPCGAEVHHVDENKKNNLNTNLVVCPSRSYHKLLHTRTKALDACGNAGWIKCWICKKYDDPKNMYVRKSKGRHAACHRAYEKARKESK